MAVSYFNFTKALENACFSSSIIKLYDHNSNSWYLRCSVDDLGFCVLNQLKTNAVDRNIFIQFNLISNIFNKDLMKVTLHFHEVSVTSSFHQYKFFRFPLGCFILNL